METQVGWIRGPEVAVPQARRSGAMNGLTMNLSFNIAKKEVMEQGGFSSGAGLQANVAQGDSVYGSGHFLVQGVGRTPPKPRHVGYFFTPDDPEKRAARGEQIQRIEATRLRNGLEGGMSLMAVPFSDYVLPVGFAVRGGPYLELNRIALSLSGHAQATLHPTIPLQAGVLVGVRDLP